MNLRTLRSTSFVVAMFASATARGQTASDLNAGSTLTPTSTPGIYSFSWWGRSGRTYFVQTSEDMVHWTYLPILEPGADQLISWNLTSTGSRFFVHLKYTDILTNDPFNDDFDGDGVSNWDELQQGTDPLAIEGLAANGIPDAWEMQYFGHTGVDPYALAPGGSGLTNLQTYRLGLNPLVASTAGDSFTDGFKIAHALNPHHKILPDTNNAMLELQLYTVLHAN